MFAYACTYIHYITMCVCVCMHVRMWYTYTHMYTYIYIYTYIYRYRYRYVLCRCVYVYMHTYVCKHTHTHTHTETHPGRTSKLCSARGVPRPRALAGALRRGLRGHGFEHSHDFWVFSLTPRCHGHHARAIDLGVGVDRKQDLSYLGDVTNSLIPACSPKSMGGRKSEEWKPEVQSCELSAIINMKDGRAVRQCGWRT